MVGKNVLTNPMQNDRPAAALEATAVPAVPAVVAKASTSKAVKAKPRSKLLGALLRPH